MNGYLQRIALSAVKPVESIHPVLGSLFSPMETGQPATVTADRPGFVSLAESKPLLVDPNAHAFQAPEPTSTGQRSEDSNKNVFPTSNQLLNPLLSSAEEQREMLIAPLLPEGGSDEDHRGPRPPRHESTARTGAKQTTDGHREELAHREVVATAEAPAKQIVEGEEKEIEPRKLPPASISERLLHPPPGRSPSARTNRKR